MSKEFIKRILSSLILIPIALFFILKGSIFFNFFILVVLLITLYEWHLLSLKKNYYLPGFTFIVFSFYTFYFFRNDDDYKTFLLIFIVCVATDIGGYVFGKIFKGPKLGKISPNKTYAGMFGSFLLSIISASIYFNNLSFFFKPKDDGEISIQIMIIVLFISFVIVRLICCPISIESVSTDTVCEKSTLLLSKRISSNFFISFFFYS